MGKSVAQKAAQTTYSRSIVHKLAVSGTISEFRNLNAVLFTNLIRGKCPYAGETKTYSLVARAGAVPVKVCHGNTEEEHHHQVGSCGVGAH